MGTNVLESRKKKKSARVLEKKEEEERMRVAGMFLNEGEKENKRRGGGEIEIAQRVWEEKNKKKR